MLGSENVPVARSPLGPTIPMSVVLPLTTIRPTMAMIATMAAIPVQASRKPTRSPRTRSTLTSMRNHK